MDFSNEEFLAKIINLGSLGYPILKCISVLEIKTEEDIQKFKEEFKNPKSEIYKNYHIGIDLYDFDIDCRLLSLAKSGDLKALKEIEKRKSKYKGI